MLISSNCSDLGAPNIEISKFPDGENYVRLLEFSDIVLHRCYPGPNSSLFQLFQILDVLKESKITPRVIVPYLIYARQEKRALDGEAISTNTIFQILASFGVKELITFNCHFIKNSRSANLYGVHINNISLAEYVIDRAQRICHGKTLIIAPDEGALGLGAQTCFIKRRGEYIKEKGTTYRQISILDDSRVRREFETHNYDNAILIDDIIASGGTMLRAAKKCKEIGFKKVVVACVHAQFLNDVDKELMQIVDDIISTNTIRNRFEQVNFFDVLKSKGIV